MYKKLANSTWCCNNIDEALSLVKTNRYLEWDLNLLPFSLNIQRMTYVRDFIQDNGEVRFHLPYAFWDIGVNEKTTIENSLSYYRRIFEMMEFLNAEYAVVHVGAFSGSNEEIALKNLHKLAGYANDNGVNICVENLLHGLSSDMSFLKKSLNISNVNMCLDTGHAECLYRKQGEEVFKIISSFKDKIIHAHVYHYEDENMNHIPLNEETIKGYKWVELLKEAPCAWYTMELDFKEDQDRQKVLVSNYLSIL